MSGEVKLMPEALNIHEGLYLDSAGSTWPVTNWLDEDGNECLRDEAVMCVAGHEDHWFSLVLAHFTGVRHE